RNVGAAGAAVTVRRHRTATGRVSKLGRVLRRRRCEPALRRVRVSRRLALDLEIHLAPLRSGDRPLVFEAELIPPFTAAGADLELDRRLSHGPGGDALQPVLAPAERLHPPCLPIGGIEVRAA